MALKQPFSSLGRRNRNRKSWKIPEISSHEHVYSQTTYNDHGESNGYQELPSIEMPKFLKKEKKKNHVNPTHPQFLLSAQDYRHWPDELYPEVAFWGRSNVGKSSFLNELLGHSLAHVSKTPGRTQQLNFYHHPKGLRFVDMPGYGYANAPSKARRHWERHILSYLENRSCLKHVYLLIDGRRGLMDIDEEVLNMLLSLNIYFSIVITKKDTISKNYIENLEKSLKNHPLLQNVSLFFVSSKTRDGIKDLTNILENKFFSITI